MAITPSFVQVAPDSTGKYIDNVQLNNGSEDVQRQVTATGDPEFWDAIARVMDEDPPADAMGMVVRTLEGNNYDSGRVVLPTGNTTVTANETKVKAIILINQTTQLQHVTVRDNSNNIYVDAKPLQPKEFLPLKFEGITLAGIKWNAGNANAVVGQIVGSQNA